MLGGERQVASSTAQKVAKWLVEKGRRDESLALLSAEALRTGGPGSHELLADAFRIDAASPLAKAAFERMEGLPGESRDLDAALARYTAEEIARLESEMGQASFNRAQVGFNNNVKYKEKVYHIQTEDSGLSKPHIITHLFADGGRVVKSHKRSYADHVSRADVTMYVRSLMKAQQMEMIIALRDGRFDPVIDGKAVGGLEVLEHAPVAQVKRLEKRPSEGRVPAMAPPRPRPAPKVRLKLHVLRSFGGAKALYELAEEDAILGTRGSVPLEGERFCHPAEAALRWRDERLHIEDFDGGNGVFLRVRNPIELELGDEFIVGDQLLRVDRNPPADDGPSPEPTYFYSSPKWQSAFRVAQIFEGGAEGSCVVARGTTLQVGSRVGDLAFPSDPLVSDPHCFIEEQAGAIVLTDLQSRTGVFVRIKGEHELNGGDEIIVGRTRLLVETVAAV